MGDFASFLCRLTNLDIDRYVILGCGLLPEMMGYEFLPTLSMLKQDPMPEMKPDMDHIREPQSVIEPEIALDVEQWLGSTLLDELLISIEPNPNDLSLKLKELLELAIGSL